MPDAVALLKIYTGCTGSVPKMRRISNKPVNTLSARRKKAGVMAAILAVLILLTGTFA